MLAVLLVGIYLLAGALHGFCDLDVSNASGGEVAWSVDKDAGQTGKGAVAEHHCHGCFSVFVPAPATVAAGVEPASKMILAHVVVRRGLSPGIDLPPPKSLT